MLAVTSYIMYAVLAFQTDKKNKEFIAFLSDNYSAVMSGAGAEYNGHYYTADTQLTRHRMCISYLVMTSSRLTWFVPADDPGSNSTLCLLITLFGGWWGIPWGPIKSIETFTENAGTKNVITVSDLIFTLRSGAAG